MMHNELAKYQPNGMTSFLPIVWANAKDYLVTDIEGKEYIDFTSGIFVANAGHANDRVVNAVKDVLTEDILFTYNYPDKNRKLEYLKKLTEWTGFEKAILLNTGAEAIEGAVSLMELYQPRPLICSLKGAYHGETWAARALGSKKPSDRFPSILTVDELGYWMAHLGVAGFMVETYEGWSGKFHDKKFIQDIASICKQNKTLLCFDEIQAGFGRTGKKFGYEHYEVEPDLVCCSKAMGSGFPIGAVLGRAEIIDLAKGGDIWSTFSANPMACAAGLATINEFERLDLIKEAEEKGEILHQMLDQIPDIEVNGKGMMAGVMFENPIVATKVTWKCCEKGLLVVHTGKRSVKIGPPLTISLEALEKGVDILESAIQESV